MMYRRQLEELRLIQWSDHSGVDRKFVLGEDTDIFTAIPSFKTSPTQSRLGDEVEICEYDVTMAIQFISQLYDK